MFPEIGTRSLAANPAAGQLVTGIVVSGAGPARRDRFDTPIRTSRPRHASAAVGCHRSNRPLPAAEVAHTATANLRSLVLP